MTTFTSDDREEAYKKILAEAPAHIGYEDAVDPVALNVEPIPFAGWVNASPPHIVDSGASVMKDEPVAYINVEERKLEWAKPMAWHTPTIAQMDKIPLYTHPTKTLTDEEIAEVAKDFFLSQYVPYDFVRAILKKAQNK